MHQPVGAPILGHVHVPKTAGSSIRQVLDDHLGSSHIHLYFDHSTTFVYGNRELASLVQPAAVTAFSSHFVRRFPSLLAGRPVHYFAFLRDPVQQFISYVTYTRKHYTAIREPVLLSHLPPHMPDLSIRECARWILNAPAGQFRNFSENYATNFFARYSLLDRGIEYGTPEYRRKRLRAAGQVLRGFLLAGISERMEESWRILRYRAAKAGIELPDRRIPTENVTAAERDSLDWLYPDDEVGGKLLASVAEDARLYRWALRHLEGAVRQGVQQGSAVKAWFQSILPARLQLLP